MEGALLGGLDGVLVGSEDVALLRLVLLGGLFRGSREVDVVALCVRH